MATRRSKFTSTRGKPDKPLKEFERESRKQWAREDQPTAKARKAASLKYTSAVKALADAKKEDAAARKAHSAYEKSRDARKASKRGVAAKKKSSRGKNS